MQSFEEQFQWLKFDTVGRGEYIAYPKAYIKYPIQVERRN